MNICTSTNLKLNICDFDKILKTKCNLQYPTRNCRIKKFNDFERDEVDAYLWRGRILNVEEKCSTRTTILPSV